MSETGRNGWLLTLNYAAAWQKREGATKIDTETGRTVAEMGGKQTTLTRRKATTWQKRAKKSEGAGQEGDDGRIDLTGVVGEEVAFAGDFDVLAAGIDYVVQGAVFQGDDLVGSAVKNQYGA